MPSGTFGNAGRNILRGPGWVTFDMSVQRRINFTDRVNATLRWDIVQHVQPGELRAAAMRDIDQRHRRA